MAGLPWARLDAKGSGVAANVPETQRSCDNGGSETAPAGNRGLTTQTVKES